MKGIIIGFSAKGESGKQEITIALDKEVDKIPVGRSIEIKVK